MCPRWIKTKLLHEKSGVQEIDGEINDDSRKGRNNNGLDSFIDVHFKIYIDAHTNKFFAKIICQRISNYFRFIYQIQINYYNVERKKAIRIT